MLRKKLIEDIVPPNPKRTVRDVNLPSRGNRLPPTSLKKVEPAPVPPKPLSAETPRIKTELTYTSYPSETKNFQKSEETPPPLKEVRKESEYTSFRNPRIPSTESVSTYSKKITRIASIGGFAVAIALVYFLYLFLHVGAVITITPKTKDIGIKATYAAKKNPQPGDLAFNVLSLEETGDKTIPSTGEKTVERRATGSVVIFNKTSKSQALVKNTRLETDDNLIFRIDNSVVVPAQKGSTPGSVEVTVSAYSAGEDYNIPLSDFTIPGFKGDPRFNTIFGRSKTPMTGGMKGTIKTASQSDLEAGQTELKATLKAKLLSKAKEQVPAGFILYDNAVYITYTMLSKPDDTDISIKGSMHGILFKKDELATFLAKNNIPDYNGDPVTSINLQNLSFSPDSLETAPWNSGNLPFTLQGTTTITWLYDNEKLVKDLAGVPQSKVNEIFKNYAGIEKAEVSIRPAWKSSLPEDSSKIEIVNSGSLLK
jgi:hypothetical protein